MVVVLIVIAWAVFALAGAFLYGAKGFWWALFLGPIGIAIVGRRTSAAAKQEALAAEHREWRERSRSKPAQPPLRWPGEDRSA